MPARKKPDITDVIGAVPYRLTIAGGWFDQPFMSVHDPDPPGSVVVVGVEPTCWFMERSGMATSTRNVALNLWKGKLPRRKAESLVRELYAEENLVKEKPSGSQDMNGIVRPGISRLDYDYAFGGGVFPKHVESNTDSKTIEWLEGVLHLLPVGPPPEEYDPLGEQHLDPRWVRRLGQNGMDCFDAICHRDVNGLGHSMNEMMACWESLLPYNFRHPVIKIDLIGLLSHYQSIYPGAELSGCGGGYLIVASETPVPGSFQIKIRTDT